MARAKQTARAEARRRHRVATRAVEPEGTAEDEAADAAPPAARSNRSTVGSDGIRRRPSMLAAFRSAYHRPDFREDVRALPKLIVSIPFVGSLAMVVVGELLWTIYPGYSGSAFAFQYLTVPPAIVPLFTVGFFSKRASYMLGAILGLLDTIVFLSTYRPLPAVSDALGLAFTSIVMGAVLAAGLAWYRRFLSLTTPARQPVRNPPRSQRQQAGGRRRY